MARRKQDKVIETLTNKLGEKAEIKFHAERGIFYCTSRTIGAKVENSDFLVVKGKVQELLDGKVHELTWKPVIELQIWQQHQLGWRGPEDAKQVGFVGFRVRRYWVAPRNADTLRCWIWEDTVMKGFRVEGDERAFPRYEDRPVPVNREEEAEEFAFEGDWNALPFCDKGAEPSRIYSGHRLNQYHTTWFDYDEALWNTLQNYAKLVNTGFELFKEMVKLNSAQALMLGIPTLAVSETIQLASRRSERPGPSYTTSGDAIEPTTGASK